MSAIDEFANMLLEQAKRFLERASDCGSPEGACANRHAAVMVAFCALEAHINGIASDFAILNSLSTHEKGFMLEQDVVLQNGEFELKPNSLKIVRLEERIQFIHHRFSGKSLDTTTTWWTQLRDAMKLRNRLTHPKDAEVISQEEVARAIQAIIDTLNALFLSVYQKKFPAASRGLASKLNFL